MLGTRYCVVVIYFSWSVCNTHYIFSLQHFVFIWLSQVMVSDVCCRQVFCWSEGWYSESLCSVLS